MRLDMRVGAATITAPLAPALAIGLMDGFPVVAILVWVTAFFITLLIGLPFWYVCQKRGLVGMKYFLCGGLLLGLFAALAMHPLLGSLAATRELSDHLIYFVMSGGLTATVFWWIGVRHKARRATVRNLA